VSSRNLPLRSERDEPVIKPISRRIVGAALALQALLWSSSAGAGRQVAVIVNRAAPTSSLTTETIRAYYLKQHKEWPSGEKVRPVQQEGQAHSAFLGKVLKMSSADYERYWLERKYSAAETPPKLADDDEAVVKFVGALNGAIGYVDAGALDEKARNKVKVIHVFTL
jgi:ABC-type phosphate transport system substrate-binding protein